jgi:cytoskeletal protein RodZ
MVKSKTKSSKNNTVSQKELIIVMIITLILGVGGGYLIGANTSENSSTQNTSMINEKSSHSHSHSAYEVSAEEAPKVKLVVTEDAKSGYNVKIIATDFTFTPESVNGENVLGEGHAHLYVDGEKVGRLYGPYFHYDGSFEGLKTFRVTLNANDHSEYTVDGEVIGAEVVVTHDSSDANNNDSHSDSEPHSDDMQEQM